MKICLLADAESIHTVRWCNHFAEHGFDVHLISFKQAQILGIKTYHVNAGTINVSGGNWRVILQYSKVKALIKQINPDVLHSLYATSYGLVGALTGFKRYIVTPLGTDILISPNNSAIYRFILRFVFKRAKIITTMAPHMTEAMLRLGVDGNKIKEIIFGINTSIFNLNKHKVSDSEFLIASIRNFETVYNIPHFLKAVALIKAQIPNLKVKLVGDGSLKQQLIDLSKELKIDDVVSFLGKVPQADVVQLLSEARIAVTTSLSDGNSLSLLESMACGAYPIATDIPANRQWVIDGVNGKLVKIDDVIALADAIMQVYKNYNALMPVAISKSEDILAQKGTWQVNMQKMEEIYKNVANLK